MISTFSHQRRSIVIDANLAVWAVLPNIAEMNTLKYIQAWYQQERRIIAPEFLIAETTSVVRRLVYLNRIDEDEGKQAIDDLFALGIETITLTCHVCQTAFGWASKLQQARVYDSLYLAVAEHLEAEFWTADKRLVNGAKQLGYPRIYRIGEKATLESSESVEA